MKYKIEVSKYDNGFTQTYTIKAVNTDTGKRITDTTVGRCKDIMELTKWNRWTICWSAFNSTLDKDGNDYIAPYFDTIYTAREIHKALEAGREVSDEGVIK